MTSVKFQQVQDTQSSKSAVLTQISGGEALARSLEAEGVTTIFGVPGTHNLAFYDALHEVSQLRHITARHEQGAAFMADGYARASGQVGVCISTTGPAALNMLAPLGTAFSDSSPVLSIASEIPSEFVGQEKGFFHECRDQLGMFRPVVKWAQRVNAVSAIPWTIRECFVRLHSGRPRPVVLEMPCDVFDCKGDVAIAEPNPVQPRGATPEEIATALGLLKASTRPVIWAGGGLIASGGSAALVQLAETLQAPVCTTVMGTGSITDLHPLSMGRIHLQPEAREYLSNCDLLLAIGTRFPQIETDSWSLRLPEKIIQIDLDSGEIGRNYPVSCGVVGDAQKVLEQLLERSGNLSGRPGRSQEVVSLRKAVLEGHWKRNPGAMQLIETLRKAMPPETIVVNDLTVAVYWGQVFFEVYEPRTYLYPAGFCTLGFGLPAAIGAKLACPDRPVVTLSGDGGFLFNCQELATAVQYNVPIVSVVFNDNAYGVLKPQQIERYGRAADALELVNPDFSELAHSFGIQAQRVQSIEELGPTLSRAVRSGQSWLIEMEVSLPWPV